MAHFAKVVNGVVTQVIVAEPEFFETFVDTTPGQWVQTSYNTKGGVHLLGGTPLRKNFAGIGFNYDQEKDAFYPSQPYPSWLLNEMTFLWEPPIPAPNDGNRYRWNEQTNIWVEVKQ